MPQQAVTRLVERELVKTIGCTNIGAFGFLGGTIAKYAVGQLRSLELRMSSLVYKNAVNVCIPFYRKPGLGLAVVLGYLLNAYDKGLELFSLMNEHILLIAQNMEASITICITHETMDKAVYLEAVAHTELETLRVVIEDDYERLTRVERNGQIVFRREPTADPEIDLSDVSSVEGILRYVEAGVFADCEQLFRAADFQYEQLQRSLHAQHAPFQLMMRSAAQPLTDLVVPLQQYIYTASKIRMEGDIYPTYAVTGSGNMGIGVLVSAKLLADALCADEARARQAVMLAFLLSVVFKFRTCVASAMCGSALSTGIASAAVAMFLKGGDWHGIGAAINNYLATSAGILCDGAKLSCGYKVSAAAVSGLLSAQMALDGQMIEQVNGLNRPDVNQTIAAVSALNDSMISNVNKGLLTVMDQTQNPELDGI